jgi:hypothetical protein
MDPGGGRLLRRVAGVQQKDSIARSWVMVPRHREHRRKQNRCASRSGTQTARFGGTRMLRFAVARFAGVATRALARWSAAVCVAITGRRCIGHARVGRRLGAGPGEELFVLQVGAAPQCCCERSNSPASTRCHASTIRLLPRSRPVHSGARVIAVNLLVFGTAWGASRSKRRSVGVAERSRLVAAASPTTAGGVIVTFAGSWSSRLGKA